MYIWEESIIGIELNRVQYILNETAEKLIVSLSWINYTVRLPTDPIYLVSELGLLILVCIHLLIKLLSDVSFWAQLSFILYPQYLLLCFLFKYIHAHFFRHNYILLHIMLYMLHVLHYKCSLLISIVPRVYLNKIGDYHN